MHSKHGRKTQEERRMSKMLKSQNSLNRDSNLLDVKVRNYGECGYCTDKNNKIILNIPLSIWSQWLYISQKMGDKEWGCVFWVEESSITQFKIPKQQVSSTECEFKDELGGTGIMHSHHDMSAFHSSQDDRHARNLYEYSIVISNSKGYEATKRVKLPCDGFGYVRVELNLVGCPELDLSKIKEKGQEFLSELYPRDYHPDLDFGIDDGPCNRCATHDCENCQVLDAEHIPCDRCESLKCRTCRFAIAQEIAGVLPFCEFCEDYETCSSCPKLVKYLENHPEDARYFEYLFANQL